MACIADSSLSSLSSVYRLSSYFFSLLRVSPPSSQRDSRHFHFNLCDRSRSLCFLILCVILQNALSVTSTSPFVKEPSTPSSPLGISAGKNIFSLLLFLALTVLYFYRVFCQLHLFLLYCRSFVQVNSVLCYPFLRRQVLLHNSIQRHLI